MGLVAARLRRWVVVGLVAVPLALNACSDATHTPGPGGTIGPTAQPTPSVPASTAIQTPIVVPSAVPPIFEKVGGLSWIGEGPDGWVAGELGKAYRRLPENEVGIVAQDNWVLSITRGKEAGITLLIRRGSEADPVPVDLADVLPSSIVISKDVAFVSGIPFSAGKDLRVFRILLPDPPAQPEPLIKPDPGGTVRNLAISADGSTLASSICQVNEEDFTSDQCVLQRIPTDGGEATSVSELPGLLSQISNDIAIVADPVADAEPGWVAGFDLGSGKQLWQVDGQIERWRIDATRGDLVVARFEAGDSPRFVVEAVNLRGGDRNTLYEQAGDAPPTFWADQSTDDFLVFSDVPDIATAVAQSADGFVPVLVIDRTTGAADRFLMFVGTPS